MFHGIRQKSISVSFNQRDGLLKEKGEHGYIGKRIGVNEKCYTLCRLWKKEAIGLTGG